jgi:predicted enzyme related to lactoylglutathione lyase
VVWFEVLGNDAPTLRAFYGKTFGWSFQMAGGGDYGMANMGAPQGIPGDVGAATPEQLSRVTFYVETPDVTATLKEITALGGTVIMPRTVRPDVTLGMFKDPEGHVIGLVEAKAA